MKPEPYEWFARALRGLDPYLEARWCDRQRAFDIVRVFRGRVYKTGFSCKLDEQGEKLLDQIRLSDTSNDERYKANEASRLRKLREPARQAERDIIERRMQFLEECATQDVMSTYGSATRIGDGYRRGMAEKFKRETQLEAEAG